MSLNSVPYPNKLKSWFCGCLGIPVFEAACIAPVYSQALLRRRLSACFKFWAPSLPKISFSICLGILSFLILTIPLQAEILPKKILQHSEKEAPKGSLLCYITPPKGWEIADPATLSKSVQIAFFKKTANHFCPSINLAIEKTDLSLQEYLKAIRHLHEANRHNTWRQLGKVHTESGIGQLTEIDTTTEWGAVRMLQLIVIHQGYAYVVTAAASKEEMPLHYKEFQAAFRTLQITSDLISTIPQLERRESLKAQSEQLLTAWNNHLVADAKKLPSFDNPSFQKNHWIPFQNHVIHDYEDMGAQWQILMLKTTQEKMLALVSPAEQMLASKEVEKSH